MTGTIALLRVASSKPWAADFNRLADTLLANQGGRVKLWGDDGLEKDRLTGLTASSGNYAADLSSAAGRHQRVRKSDDTLDVWKVEDAGATLVGGLTATGAVGITGNTTLVGTLSVSGLVAAAAALTVGTTLGVGGALTGSTAAFSGLATAPNIVAGGTALAFSEALRVVGLTRLENHVNMLNTFKLRGLEPGNTVVRNLASVDGSNVLQYGEASANAAVLSATNLKLATASSTVFEAQGNQMTFFGGTSLAGRGAVGAAATDLASCITLANNLRALVRSFNLSS